MLANCTFNRIWHFVSYVFVRCKTMHHLSRLFNMAMWKCRSDCYFRTSVQSTWYIYKLIGGKFVWLASSKINGTWPYFRHVYRVIRLRIEKNPTSMQRCRRQFACWPKNTYKSHQIHYFTTEKPFPCISWLEFTLCASLFSKRKSLNLLILLFRNNFLLFLSL